MCTIYGSATDVQRRADNLIDSQRLSSDCGADDIHHRIRGAHFVKVHLFDVSVMDLGFRRAQGLENSDRGALCAWR